jgi:adenine-specific DNA-methyltransferase
LELDNNPSDEYLAEFKKEKVVWQELAQGSQFAFDKKGRFFVSNTAYIMTGTHLRYLLGYLNSRLNEITYSRWYCTKLGSSGTRWLKQHVLSIPVPPITPKNRSLVRRIELLVNRILARKRLLARKRRNPHASTRDLERKIDELVYRLYDLTPDEIRLIEGK